MPLRGKQKYTKICHYGANKNMPFNTYGARELPRQGNESRPLQGHYESSSEDEERENKTTKIY
jgi:hypothetical protein